MELAHGVGPSSLTMRVLLLTCVMTVTACGPMNGSDAGAEGGGSQSGGGGAVGGGSGGGGGGGASTTGGGGGSTSELDAGVPDAGVIDAGPPLLTQEQFCQLNAASVCECLRVSGQLPAGDEVRCIDAQLSACRATRANQVDAGQERFDGVTAADCLARRAIFGCTFDCRYTPWVPAGVEGTPCDSDSSCGPRFQCPVSQACGQCVPTRQEGEPCDTTLTCDTSGKFEELRCIGPSDGGATRCLKLARAGEWCSNEFQGRRCDNTTDAGELGCRDDVCRRPPGLGEDCAGQRCREGRCVRDGGSSSCHPLLATGTSCTQPFDCEGNFCVRPPDGGAGVCGREGDLCFAGGSGCGALDGEACISLDGGAHRCVWPYGRADGLPCNQTINCASGLCTVAYDGGARTCGRAPAGSPCEDSEHCGDDYGRVNCFGATSQQPGRCFDLISDGGACENLPFPGSNCQTTNGDTLCVNGRCQQHANSLPRGAWCFGNRNCLPDDFCASDTRICTPRVTLGNTCSSTRVCAANAWCFSGVCTAIGGAGAECQGLISSPMCLIDHRCVDQRDGGFRCRPDVDAGATCGVNSTQATCLNSWCSDAGTCAPQLSAGAFCNRFDQCECRQVDGGSNITVNGGVCQPPRATCP